MATLTGTTIQSTYDSLLKVTDNDSITGSLKRITDGLGNNTPLYLSSSAVEIVSTLNVTSTITGSNLSGTNTGDETKASIETKLGAATSSNSGYLTSADWSTFSNKIAGSGTLNKLAKFSSGSSIADSTITDTGSAVTIGVATTVSGNLTATSLIKSGGTSSQILAADGSVITAGTNITIAGGTISSSGSISGTGTTNYISKFTSSSAIGNSLIYNDANSVLINDTFNIATNYKLQVTGDIYTSGSIAIGSVSSISTKLFGIGRAITGATTAYGITFEGNIESTVTTNGIVYRSYPIVTGGTLSAITHYIASKNAFIGGSTVTNQYGFFADASVSGATNNYGFYGNIASATGAWNLYMNGTAQNYINGNLGIGVAVPTVKLDVSGAGLFSSSVTASSFIKSGGTSAQLLAGDGSVVTAGTNITISGGTISSSAGLSGSGTTNYVPKFTGSSAIGNSQIFDNGTNVGIGTTSPSAKLHVYGAGANTQTIYQESSISAANAYLVQKSTSKSYITGLSTDFSNSYIIYDETASAMRLAVTSGGNVGIGTSSPSNKLQVFGSTDSYLANFTGASGGATARGLTIGTYTSLGAGDCGVEFNAAVNNTGYGQFRFSAGTNERMRIDSSGNVGIGTSSPGSTLEVNGTGRFNGILTVASGSAANATTISNSGDFVSNWIGNSTVQLFSIRNNSTTGVFLNTQNSAPLRFGVSTGTTGGTIVNHFEIASSGTASFSGSVGIGTSSPGGLLDINSASTNDRLLLSYSGSVKSAFGVTTAGVAYMYHHTSSSFPMWISAAGNFGIGTTSPSEALSVNGNIILTGTANRYIRIQSASNYYYNLQSVGDDFHIVEAGSTPRFVIKYPSGNVGIGTTSPYAKLMLSVAASASDVHALEITNNTDASFAVYLRNNITTLSAGGAGNMVFSNSSERMRITSGGNVGIGTSSPAYKLDVAGNIRTQDSLYVDNSAGTGGIFRVDGFSDYLYFYGDTSNIAGYRFGSDIVGIKMQIGTNGNVLIGTTSDNNSGAKLQVTGNITFQNIFNRRTASYTLALTDQNDIIEMNVGSANNLTVPLNSSVAFPIGTEIAVLQYGSGQTTIVATGGVTLRSKSNALKISGQFAGCTLVKVGTDEWYVVGDLTI